MCLFNQNNSLSWFRAPVIVMQLNLDNDGSHQAMAAKLLAHEFAHLMGAYHDGDGQTVSYDRVGNPFRHKRKNYKFGFWKKINCPNCRSSMPCK